MLKDIKLEAVDQTVSMLIKKEPCSHDPVVSLASSNVTRPDMIKTNLQAGSGMCSSVVRNEAVVVGKGSNPNNSSSSRTVPQLHPRDPRKRPVVIPALSPLSSSSSSSSPQTDMSSSSSSHNAVNKRPVEQATKIASSGSFHSNKEERGASSVVNNVTKSPVVVVSKQIDVVGSSSSSSIHHQRPVIIENHQRKQATLDNGYSLAENNTCSSSNQIAVSPVVHDGDCSAKPIVLNQATTVKKSNNKIVVSPAAYRASRKERFSSEKVYTTSIPPYDSPSSSSPRQQPSAGTITSSVKRTADTSVDELRQQEHVALDSSCDENLVAMEGMLRNLKDKLVTLTLDLCTTPNKSELTDAFCATTTQIDYVKRTIASLKQDTPPAVRLANENYKKLLLMMRLVPYFQWEGNVTNAREKVFTTIYACLRQVDTTAQDYDFDIEREWKSLIFSKVSSQMHHWLDGLLTRKPQLSWTQFKKHLLQEYEMPFAEAIKQLTLAYYNAEIESMNAFVSRFVRNLEYSKVSEDLGATYFQSSLPSLEDRSNFGILYQGVKKNHPQEKNNVYRAIELFRDIHNQACPCNDAFKNPPLPTPQPQPYELHHRSSQQQQQQQQQPQPQQPQARSISPKVEVVRLQQPKLKKQKLTHQKKQQQLRCVYHPKAHSHSTENCKKHILATNIAYLHKSA
ncbi:hypothetical protein PS15m_005687 [Mucor circinelloides]